VGNDETDAMAEAAPGSTLGPSTSDRREPSAPDGAPAALSGECLKQPAPEGTPAAASGDRQEPPAFDNTPDPDFEAFKKQHARTSVRGWVQLVCDAVEKDAWTLVIDDLSDLTASTGRLIDRLAPHFRVVAALHEVRKPYEKHFWKFERIALGNLPPDDARRLIRQASQGVEIEDRQLLETHLLQKTNGNPRAILESVDRLRKEPAVTRNAVRELSHTGAQQQFDLTPVVVIPLIAITAFRFIARGLDSMDFYLVAGLGSALAMAARFYLFRSRRK
jgi:hypothetical protein